MATHLIKFSVLFKAFTVWSANYFPHHSTIVGSRKRLRLEFRVKQPSKNGHARTRYQRLFGFALSETISKSTANGGVANLMWCTLPISWNLTDPRAYSVPEQCAANDEAAESYKLLTNPCPSKVVSDYTFAFRILIMITMSSLEILAYLVLGCSPLYRKSPLVW